MRMFNKGDKVEWNWAAGTGSGTVAKCFTGEVEREIKGTTVRRNASDDNPAYLIRQEDGDEVLKSHSELTRVG